MFGKRITDHIGEVCAPLVRVCSLLLFSVVKMEILLVEREGSISVREDSRVEVFRVQNEKGLPGVPEGLSLTQVR